MTDIMILVLGISIGTAILVGAIVYALSSKIVEKDPNTIYDKQLAELIGDDDDTPKSTIHGGPFKRWNTYWARNFNTFGWDSYAESASKAGRTALLAFLGITIVFAFLLQNLVAGILIAIGVMYGGTVALRSRGRKNEELINNQLPGFLFALKANIEANETPEYSLIRVVNDMPSPLREDLMVAKNMILANSTFKEALEELSRKTASNDLKFLCACMIQASLTGANIENQIAVIQKSLEQKSEANDALQKAIRSMAPAIIVSASAVPVCFLATLILNPTAKEFWFVHPYSWVCLGVVAILYAAGLWCNKALVESIKKL